MNESGMAGLATKNTGVDAMALRLAQEAPTLSNLSAAQLEQIAKIVLTQKLVGELGDAVTLAGIDYDIERSIFVDNAGHADSEYTRSAYCAALDRFEQYADKHSIKYLMLTPTQADDYIYFLKSEGRAPASIRRDISAVSAFFTFMERRHPNLKNPFRGTRARPQKKSVRKTEIPTPEEVIIINGNLPPLEKAITAVMYGRGLRAGALPPMSLWGAHYSSRSKGKDISGDLPTFAIDAIKAAALDGRTPFVQFSVNAIELRIKHQMERLYGSGIIRFRYSCHDFRHFYAVTEYQKDHDIHRLSKLLDHSSIAITETYLKSLGKVDI
jgi:site-specific recombinase XerD